MNFKIYNFKTLTSTQDKAKELGKKGMVNSAVIAQMQTKGRGRMQRKWHSAKGNLYMSIALNPHDIENIQHLTLAAAVAIVKVLQKNKINATIKWPNDINFKGKKLCGILTEGVFEKERFVVVGIGLNVNQSKFPKDISGKATSLKIILGKDIDIGELSKKILNEFEKLYKKYEENKLTQIRNQWKKYSDTIGKAVAIASASGTIKGKAVSLNEDCSLKVKSREKTIDVYEGDVGVRY